MKRFSFLVLVVLSMILVNCTGKQDATKGEITVYTALEDDQVKVYLDRFYQSYPDIKVNLVRNSTGIVTAKLLAEKDNPVADVVWGTAATSLLLADEAGLLAPYAPKGIERVKAQYKDSRKVPHWVGIDAWMTGIVVNTVEMEKAGLSAPKSYNDLINPVFQNKLVMPNPASSGTGYLTVSAILQLMGEEKGWEYLDKLHANMATYTHSGSKPAKLAGAGEYPVGISFGYRGIKQKQSGQPVETYFPIEGSGWDLEANALIMKKEIKEQAKLFLDWAISDGAMEEYAKSFAIITVESSIKPPAGFPQNPEKQLIKNDFNWAAKNRERILNEWSRRYDSKSEPKK
ncbi:MAG: putative 2-aminoethylphosphonate ABC transporter substrate-binding protein [Candidatus Delongbacteria bacterium]|nr:putative 2-aminoethylphosphonate ABC transporter substrate-binding protein [Candidatus Delongbacteria bacterium]MBN2834387.1 putative 2-aminoethylphosphonate ABC transporter substrate-binding protein [Candidatus Delongbacteria bacterium]